MPRCCRKRRHSGIDFLQEQERLRIDDDNESQLQTTF
jgi:hypothetical protein